MSSVTSRTSLLNLVLSTTTKSYRHSRQACLATSEFKERTQQCSRRIPQSDHDLQLQIGDLGSLNDNFSAANELLQEQLNSANAAREDAERRATNLRSAFVPQANQFSTSFSYGDFRASERKKQNNQLSDLQMLGNGLGTPTNPLAGLQLS